jgi:hypothetical protein
VNDEALRKKINPRKLSGLIQLNRSGPESKNFMSFVPRYGNILEFQ